MNKEDLIKIAKKLDKKFPEARIGFKAKLIEKSPSGEKRDVWYIKTSTKETFGKKEYNIWIPDRYRVSVKYGKEYSYLGFVG